MAPTHSETVAAVVVTFNRSRLLQECLEALLRQTRPLDAIVLIDNASSDDTVETLRFRGYLEHPKIRYTRLESNTGGAGGFCEGVRRAYELGFAWMWIMDDDAEPYDDALEKMEPSFSTENVGGVANLTIGLDGLPQQEHRGWIELCSTRTRAHRTIDASTLTENIQISFASFVGLAVHRRAVEKIGLPKREMFIKADDLEYCVRLATLGPLLLVPQSRILHKDGVSANYQRRRRLGFQSERVPIDKLWLNYFPLRNLLWIRRRHCGNLIAAGFAFRQLIRLCLGIILFDSHRLMRIRFYWNAIYDAWHDVFDNDKPRRLTKVARAQ